MRTFSIITPIYAYNQQKVDELIRCIKSIAKQTYPKNHIEHIIINDGSIVPLKIPDYPWVKVYQQSNMQRITAYNNGLKKSKNQILWMLDADDELVWGALRYISDVYDLNFDYEMLNFGCEYVHKDRKITKRDAFRPKEDEVGHEIFGGGNIVNGTFVFTRKVYEDLGAFPPPVLKNVDCTDINYPAGGSQYVRELSTASPYDFSAMAQLEFPEIRSYFMVNVESEPGKIIKELGNPFGQDFYLAYKYTRKYHMKPLPEYLERVYIR